jgi:hypothetical protein
MLARISGLSSGDHVLLFGIRNKKNRQIEISSGRLFSECSDRKSVLRACTQDDYRREDGVERSEAL